MHCIVNCLSYRDGYFKKVIFKKLINVWELYKNHAIKIVVYNSCRDKINQNICISSKLIMMQFYEKLPLNLLLQTLQCAAIAGSVWLFTCVRDCCKRMPTWQLSSLLKLKLDQLESWSGKAHWRQKISFPCFKISTFTLTVEGLIMPLGRRHCYRVLTAYLFSKSDP